MTSSQQQDTPRPVLWLIAGVNGAGKTTFYHQRLKPSLNLPYVNADEIAKTHWPEDPTAHAYDAMQEAERQRAVYLASQQSFVAETVFSHPSKLALIREAQRRGYRVNVVFINVSTTDLALRRVSERVQRGGHDVPAAKIRARHARTLTLIAEAVKLADEALLFDNSQAGQPPRWVMSFAASKIDGVACNLPQWAQQVFAHELAEYRTSVSGRP